MEDKRIIEINGVKLEIDMRHARTIEHYRIGDNVKVLRKEYSDQYTSYPGVIVGFDAFEERPTIVICYLKSDWQSTGIQFVYLNTDSKDIEICPMRNGEIVVERIAITQKLDNEIAKKQLELDDLLAKKKYFLENFGRYFEQQSGNSEVGDSIRDGLQ